MKNIQKQYQDLLEGKMSKANFMRNVRMQFPQHISPVTSYDDSVKILKGKRILSEGFMDMFGKKEKQLPTFPSHMHLNAWELRDNLKTLYKNKGREINDKQAIELINKAWETGVIPKKDEGSKQLSTDAVARLIASKLPVSEKRLNEAKQPEGVYKHNPNAEDDLYRGIDHLNKYVVDRAIKFELAQMPEITDENYVKARKKVVSKMLKDPDAYKELQIANYKDIKKRDENLKMKEYKKVGNVDKANEMKVVKKDAPASANHVTKEAKKKEKVAQMTQAPKGKLEAFPTPGKEKVMALKEHLLEDLTSANDRYEEIGKGSRVKKKELTNYDKAGVGNVEEFDTSTATVKWDNGEVEHVQRNVLTKKDIPQHPKAAETLNSLPNMGSVRGPDTGVDPKLTQMQEVDKEIENINVEKNDMKSKLKRIKERLIKAIKKEEIRKNPLTNKAVSTMTSADNALANKMGYTASVKSTIEPLGKIQ